MKRFLSVILVVMMFFYVMPVVLAGNDTYLVEDLYFSTLSGTVIENPTDSCVVNVEVKKQQLRFGNDDVIIASYATDGSLLGFTTVSGTISMGETSLFKTLVTIPKEKTLGKVKAYVWNSVLGMQPLSNCFTVTVNQMDDGTEIIPPVQEKYIPDTITVCGTIDTRVNRNEYRLNDAYIYTDYSSAYTQSEYDALVARYQAISDYYGINLKVANRILSRINAVSTIDLDEYLLQQGEFTIAMDEEGGYVILNFEPKKSSKVKKVSADDLEDVDYYNNRQIKFGTTKYNFENAVRVYVNGDLYYAAVGAAADDVVIKNILDAAIGDVTLIKAVTNSSYYDTILLNSYVMGQITAVVSKNGASTVKFSPTTNNLGSYKSIVISDSDIEEGLVNVNVILDGEKSSLKNLRENDVIAIKTKIGAGTVIDATNENITILASRDTISGKVSSIEDGFGENAFVINGERYAATDKGAIGLIVGKTYNAIYLDPFGRIFSYDDESVFDNKNYAILAKVTDKTDITLVLPDGTRKAYEAKDAYIYTANGGVKSVETPNVAVAGVTTGASVINCVVEYTVKSGQINSIKAVSPVAFTGAAYKESVAKVGTVGIGSATGVINTDGALSYKDYTAMKANEFIDEEIYSGAGFGRIAGTNKYAFIVLTIAGFDYNKYSRFAVIDADGWSKGSDADGDPVDQLKVLLNGEKTTLDFEPKFADSSSYAYIVPVRGTAFYYTVDSDGLVDACKPITRAQITSTGTISLAGLFGAGNYDSTKWGNYLYGNEDIMLVKGLVVKSGTNSVSLIAVPNAYDTPVDIDDFETFDIAGDCIIYTYDIDPDIADKDRLNENGSLVASNFKNWRITDTPAAMFAEAYTDTNSNGVYDLGEAFTDANGNGVWDDQRFYTVSDVGKIVWGFSPSVPLELAERGIKASKFDTLYGTTAADNANYALAMIVDNKVVEIYEILSTKDVSQGDEESEEPVLDNKNYAILAKVTDKTDITLVLPDGTRKAYEAKDASIYAANGGVNSVEAPNMSVAGVTTGASVINCVVEYTVKSGQINSIKAVSPVIFSYAAYKESVAKVGTVGIGNTTGVINTDGASSYKDYTAMKANEFIDEEIYSGAGFGRIAGTNKYAFIVLTIAGFDYNKYSRFAVIDADGWSKGSDADGDPVDQLKVLLNGEKTTLDFEPKFADSGNGAYFAPVRGTAFFYTKDSDGLVDAYKPISIANITSAGTIGLAGLFGAGRYDNTKWTNTIGGNDDILLVKGLVVKTGTNSVSLLATPDANEAPLDIDAFETYSLADDCLIYTYDTDSEVAAKDKLDAEGVLVAENFKDWRITDTPSTISAEWFSDANRNGIYDLGESFTDANGNGVYDAGVAYAVSDIGKIVWGFAPTASTQLTARGIKANQFDKLNGTAANDAQYALALIVDNKVVEIYEILAD